MPRLFLLLFLLDLALTIVALIDCLSTDVDEVRALPKLFWVLLIVLFSPIGAIAWFFAGRPQTTQPEVSSGSSSHPAGRGPSGVADRRVAPDDDPEFLRDLGARTRRDNEDLLRKWEADLRRREEELRRRDKSGGSDPPVD